MNTLPKVVVFLLLTSASHAETCGRLSPLENVGDMRGYYLVLQSLNSSYVVDTNCAILRRTDFAKKLQFKMLPTGTGDQTTVFVRSYRTLVQPQLSPIKMSRGGDWFFPNTKGGAGAPLPNMKDEPFRGSLADWDAAHSTPGNPKALSDRLKATWHAYAGPAKTGASTEDLSFWTIAGQYDLSHASLTNYLLTFPAASKSAIPFDVYLQDDVSEIVLTTYSRDESLSGTYRFLIPK
jgi:hypothetical protein